MAEEIKKEVGAMSETTEEAVNVSEEVTKAAEDTETVDAEAERVEETTKTLDETAEKVEQDAKETEETAKKPETAERIEKVVEKETAQEEEKIEGYIERKRLLFFGLPWTFTKYTVKNDLLTIQTGLLKTEENDCYMYKIQDVKLVTTLIERLFRLGTVICYTGDVTNPEIHLEHIKHAKDVKNYILKASEEARIKRRTLNTMDIGAIVEDDSCECDHTHIE